MSTFPPKNSAAAPSQAQEEPAASGAGDEQSAYDHYIQREYGGLTDYAKRHTGSSARYERKGFEAGYAIALSRAQYAVPEGFVLAPYPINDELGNTEFFYMGRPLPQSVVRGVYHAIVRQLAAPSMQPKEAK